MSEKSPSNRRLEGRANRRTRRSHVFVSVLSAMSVVVGGLILAVPGQAEQAEEPSASAATPESAGGAGEESSSNEQETDSLAKKGPPQQNVCLPLDSGKIDTTGGPTSVTIPNAEAPLPAGNVIVQYCVKAGSAGQGDGPKYVGVDPPQTSVTFSYPGDKEISHYSFAYEPAATTGSLQILKELSNPDGAEVPETFSIEYECTLGDNKSMSGTVDVAPGMTGETVSGIPTGSTCTISEAKLPIVEGFSWAEVMYNPRSVEITSPDMTYTTIAQNDISMDQVGLELTKTLTGGPSDYTGPFTIDYVCTKGEEPEVSGSETIEAGSSVMVTGLTPGYECVVSEPVLPSAPAGYTFGVPTFDPKDGSVTIRGKRKTTVTTNNTLARDEGNLRITKVLTGTPGDFDPEFDVSYLCTSPEEMDISGTTTITDGGSVVVPEEGTIPGGYECTVTEGALPGLPAGYTWGAPAYTNNQLTEPGNVVTIVKNTVVDQDVPVDQMATVNITNSATLSSVPVTPASSTLSGALAVSKILTGGPAGFAPSFAVGYSCSGPSAAVSGELSLAPGDTATVFDVPSGAACSVSENELPAAPEGFTWAQPQITGSPTASISGGVTAEVTVVNTLVAEEVGTPVEPASPVTPVEPASPVTPVEPASPVEPAGFPTVVPAGGGALSNVADSLPIWQYLVVVLGLALGIGGSAYLIRGK